VSFDNGLQTEVSTSGFTSGYVRFYEARSNGSDFIDLHIQSHSLAGSINLFLPNSVDNEVLVGRSTVDTRTNKTIQTCTGNNSAVITTPSTTGTLVGETSNWTLTNGS